MSKKLSGILSLTANIIIIILVISMQTISLIKGTRFYFGPESFKYFTILSNLFLGVACFIYVLEKIIKKISKLSTIIKYLATITTTITFLVAILVFGPLAGYNKVFDTPQNTVFHSINPVIALVSFIFFERHEEIEFKYTFINLIPIVVYSIFYLCLYLIKKEDLYGLFEYGILVNILGGIGLFIVVYGLGVLLRYINNLNYNKFQEPSREKGRN